VRAIRKSTSLLSLLGCVSILSVASCSSNPQSTGPGSNVGGDQGAGGGAQSGSSSGGSTAGTGADTSGVQGGPGDNGVSAGSTGGTGSGSTSAGGSGGSGGGSSTGSQGSGGSSSGSGATSDAGTVLPVTDAAPPSSCMKGTTQANRVVMLGDSYMDPSFGDVGPHIMMDANNAMYRHYYLAGAATNNGSGQLNIPYQYTNMAKTDVAVMNPAQIDIVIMDGGGNDVLIDQQSCLTVGPTQMACATAISGAVAATKKLWQQMATDGVKHIVYYFYPHLDPAGGGLLPTPSTYVNDTDDYAAPLYQQICCGSTFTPTTSNASCRGNAPGTDCVYIDTRPIYNGHATDWIQSDHVHPNMMGATAIANLVWTTMTADCIAQ